MKQLIFALLVIIKNLASISLNRIPRPQYAVYKINKKEAVLPARVKPNKKQMIVTLTRRYKGIHGTTGRLTYDGKHICDSLERPKTYKGFENLKDNATTEINESCCIPEGVYDVIYTYSPTFKTWLFLLEGTGSRTGIRIHSANTIDELLGCIAPVTNLIPLTYKGKKYQNFGTSSVKACHELYKTIPKDELGKPVKWKLKITSDESL